LTINGPIAIVGPGIVVVTGTGTDVGKTVVTAALAAVAAAHGQRVAVVKPVQTGVRFGEPGDATTARALAQVERETPPTAGRPSSGRISAHEFTRLPEPLAPDIAARRAGVTLPPVGTYPPRIEHLARHHDLVLVEGAGGLLVRLDQDGGTLADLVAALPDARVVVVVAAGLGTLNHSELTTRELHRRNLTTAGLVIGAWPPDAGPAEQENLSALPQVTGLPLLGMVPAGAGSLPPTDFTLAATRWLTPPGGRRAGDRADASGRVPTPASPARTMTLASRSTSESG